MPRETEAEHRRAILEAGPGWAVPAAYEYACWLEERDRIEDAVRILTPALREGPDWGARAELACVSLQNDMRAAWKRLHERLGVTPVPAHVIEDAGIREQFTADWATILAEVTPLA